MQIDGFLIQLADSGTGQIIQTLAPGTIMENDGPTHTGFPELLEMIEGAMHGGVVVGFGTEKIADVIGHFDQIFGIHGLSRLTV
jgi:hypothetical protein